MSRCAVCDKPLTGGLDTFGPVGGLDFCAVHFLAKMPLRLHVDPPNVPGFLFNVPVLEWHIEFDVPVPECPDESAELQDGTSADAGISTRMALGLVPGARPIPLDGPCERSAPTEISDRNEVSPK